MSLALPVDPDRYLVYLITMATFAVTPGPANLFAIATGIARGPRAALMGVVGMNTGTLVWFGAAALGLGALVAAFPQAFAALTLLGAGYVLWLGLKALANALSKSPSPLGAGQAARPGAAFRDGMTIQISNPKAVLFFTAVLPPFLDPSRALVPQLATFAAATLVLDGIAMSLYGLAGGALRARLADQRIQRVFSAVVGALLILAAVLIVLPHGVTPPQTP